MKCVAMQFTAFVKSLGMYVLKSISSSGLYVAEWVAVGMKDGQQIRFSGEGDQSPGLEAGDVVIVLDEKEHNVFRRRGIDLLMQMEISLTEALCGFQRSIQTLDDRSLIIMSLPGATMDKIAN